MRNDLNQLHFFQNVSKETLEYLWSIGRVKKYKKGQVLLRPREISKYIYIQINGKSIIYNLTNSGKRKILFVLGKGTLLNEHVQDIHKDSFFCETIEESSVFIIPVKDFINQMKKDFSLTQAVLVAQERKIWRLGHQLKNTMGSIYIERKLAAKLWKLARDFGIVRGKEIEIDVNLSITFLADMLGVPRETASKACKHLVEYGLININRKKITVIDKKKMSFFYKTGKIS